MEIPSEMKSLSDEPTIQLVEGDRYLLRHTNGNVHRCAFLGSALTFGAIALIFEMPDGTVFNLTQLDGNQFQISQL